MTAASISAPARDHFFAPFRGSDVPGHDEWCLREDVAVGYCVRIACCCGWGADVDLGEPGPPGRLRLGLRLHLIDAERHLLEEGEAHFLEQHYPSTPTGATP